MLSCANKVEACLVRWSAVAIIVVCILHMIALGLDAAPQAQAWLRLDLWTMEHWRPTPDQSVPMLVSGLRFWATIGSFAAPLLILAALIVWLDRRGHPVPMFVGWALLAWTTLASLVIEPSGFPLGVVASLCLLIGLMRRRAALSPG